MKILTAILGLLVVLTSCSTSNHNKLSKTLEHYGISESEKSPKLQIKIPETADWIEGHSGEKISTKEEMNVEGMQNRHLYFLSLVDQYYQLRAFNPDHHPTIKSCPSFHQTLLESNLNPEQYATKSLDFSLFQHAQDLKQLAYNHPELFFSDASSGLPLYEELSQSADRAPQLLAQVLEGHTKELYRELVELCEFGVSDEYYTFSNLINHFASAKTEGYEALQMAIKTTLFSNHALLQSLERKTKNAGRSIASENKSPKPVLQIMKRLPLKKGVQYFQKLGQ